MFTKVTELTTFNYSLVAAKCKWANINNCFGNNLVMQSHGLKHIFFFFTKHLFWKLELRKIISGLWLIYDCSTESVYHHRKMESKTCMANTGFPLTKSNPFCSRHSPLKGNRNLTSGQSEKLSIQSISLILLDSCPP